ncbi:MAG: AAA family ATPase, partial [Deltaproteobacteria bacterium]|nr:AAA family ATPase [Deltaproteobacteria bacterium]
MLPPMTAEQKTAAEARDPFLAITAYAGTGKTTTLVHFARQRPEARLLYLAFNRSLALEAKRAFLSLRQAEVRTIHSLAFRYTGRKYAEQLGSFRTLDIVPHLPPSCSGSYSLARLAGEILEGFLTGPDPSAEAYLKLREHLFQPLAALSLGMPLMSRSRRVQDKLDKILADLGRTAEKIWGLMKKGSFAMPHNGYLKLFQLEKISLDYDCLLVDEAQDLNDCMIDIILNFPGRKVLVGDPYQQIYEWNGAVNALQKTSSGSASYFLTQSFRCPANAAALADRVLKILGSSKTFTGVAGPPQRRDPGPKAFIARTTFGLFKFAAENISRYALAWNGGLAAYDLGLIKDIYHLKSGRPAEIRSP